MSHCAACCVCTLLKWYSAAVGSIKAAPAPNADATHATNTALTPACATFLAITRQEHTFRKRPARCNWRDYYHYFQDVTSFEIASYGSGRVTDNSGAPRSLLDRLFWERAKQIRAIFEVRVFIKDWPDSWLIEQEERATMTTKRYPDLPSRRGPRKGGEEQTSELTMKALSKRSELDPDCWIRRRRGWSDWEWQEDERDESTSRGIEGCGSTWLDWRDRVRKVWRVSRWVHRRKKIL